MRLILPELSDEPHVVAYKTLMEATSGLTVAEFVTLMANGFVSGLLGAGVPGEEIYVFIDDFVKLAHTCVDINSSPGKA